MAIGGSSSVTVYCLWTEVLLAGSPLCPSQSVQEASCVGRRTSSLKCNRSARPRLLCSSIQEPPNKGRPVVDRVRRQPTSRSGSPRLLIHRGYRFWAAKGPARSNLETGLVCGDSQPGGGPGEPTAFAAGAHPRPPFRTAGIAWRDNRRPQLGLSCKPLVSASVSQNPSPKTPRNREFFRVARRCAVKVSDPEDSMAVEGVPADQTVAPLPFHERRSVIDSRSR
jgi:hypothetical protein